MKLPMMAGLCLVLLAGSPARAQFSYTINDNSATLTGYDGPGGTVTVPNTLGGAQVVALGPNAFLQAVGVTSVQIPATVTNIASGAFAYSYSLTAINVNVTNAYYSSVGGVLYDAPQDTLVQYPPGLTGGFTIPDGVTNIATEAFFSDQVSSITIPESVTTIGPAAFILCLSLNQFTVDPENVNFASVDGVLFDAEQATLLQYPPLLAGSSYTIPNSVLNIGNYAFGGCVNLTIISIPASVASIGFLPFFDCVSLQAINVDPDNLTYSSINGVLFDTLQATLTAFPEGIRGNYAVPGGISTIGPQAFAYTSLSGVTLPASLTSIQDYAFAYGSQLTTAIFQGSPPTFDTTAFVGDNLQLVYLPGATGWTSPLQGMPNYLWNPVIQYGPSSPAVVNTNFGFTVTGSTNLNVSVQSTTNLSTGPWVPVQTITLTNGSSYFSVPVNGSIPGASFRLSTP